MKKTGLLIIAGIIAVLAVALFIKFVSLNLSYSILVGVASLFLVSIWQNKNSSNVVLKILLISIPLTLAYYVLIIKELPGLWIAIPLFIATVISGLLTKKRTSKLFAGLGLTIITCFIAFYLVPGIISDNLSQNIKKPAPGFEFVNVLTDEKITNASLTDKIVVLDFFGTWCAPCIAEMNELSAIKNMLSNYNNELLFIIACTDTGGDTPEKAKDFHAKRKLPFVLVYDKESAVHKRFGFTGVPGLVIIDKKGNMRFKHEGYNQAEDLQGTLIPILEALLKE